MEAGRDDDRRALNELLSALFKQNLLTVKQAERGFEDVLPDIEDIIIDVPRVRAACWPVCRERTSAGAGARPCFYRACARRVGGNRVAHHLQG
jgi:hypothetical protein